LVEAQTVEPLEDYDPAAIGGFRLLGRLGSGGMGLVYLAEADDGGLVAVKVIHDSLAGDPQFRRRFTHEIAAAARVHGTYTAQLIAADAETRRPWMATTYIDGPTLLATVERTGPLPADEVRALTAGVAEALVSIHAAGVIHRDLKPSNVVLAPAGPRVIDFGIARAVEASTVTGTGISGSGGFMSPEQAVGKTVTPASDVFSLGALIFYAATGRPAFGTGATPALMFRVVHEDADVSALTDPVLGPLARACLAKDPVDRPTPGEIADIARGLRPPPDPEAHLAAAGTASPENATVFRSAGAAPAAEQEPMPRRWWRRPAMVAAAALAIVLVGGSGAFALASRAEHGHSGPEAGAAGAPQAGVSARPSPPAPSALSSGGTATPSAGTTATRPAGRQGSAGTAVQGGGADDTSITPSAGGTPGGTGPAGSGGGPTPRPPAPVPPAPADLSSAALSAPAGLTARVYFGQLSSLVSNLSGTVTFADARSSVAAHPTECALTVVFRGVTGSQAVVYAQNLGSGWTGAELTPDSNVATDGGVVHQQVIVPPGSSAPGATWRGSAQLAVDGRNQLSGSYDLALSSVSGSRGTWRLAGTPVSCTLP
jgi:hypothetical protein